MAYDEKLAERVRAVLESRADVTEQRMFGGLAFMVLGHMVCGVVQDRLMVRVGPDAYDEALAEPFTEPMDFTGKPLKGMVYVLPEGLRSKRVLSEWVDRGLQLVSSLPPKKRGVRS